MAETNKRRRKALVDRVECVACGCCLKVCPTAALSIERGLYARVDGDKCVGCGKCVRECPASVIKMAEVTP